MQGRTYFTVSLPKVVLDEIKEYVHLNSDLYNSHIEFCIDAIRERLDEIRKEILEKEKMKDMDVVVRVNSIRERLDELIKELPKQNAEEIKKFRKRVAKK